MMKHLTLLALVAVVGLTDAVAQKLGHLDAQDILLNLPERAAAQAEIESADSEYEAEVAKMQTELETKFAEYQSKAATWPDAIRQTKEREIQQLDAGLQEFGMTIQNDLAQWSNDCSHPWLSGFGRPSKKLVPSRVHVHF